MTSSELQEALKLALWKVRTAVGNANYLLGIVSCLQIRLIVTRRRRILGKDYNFKVIVAMLGESYLPLMVLCFLMVPVRN